MGGGAEGVGLTGGGGYGLVFIHTGLSSMSLSTPGSTREGLEMTRAERDLEEEWEGEEEDVGQEQK